MKHPWRPVQRRRSFAACGTCKARHIKCDVTLPGCLNCEKRNFICPGYEKSLQWKRKHQITLSTTFDDDERCTPAPVFSQPKPESQSSLQPSNSDSSGHHEYQQCLPSTRSSKTDAFINDCHALPTLPLSIEPAGCSQGESTAHSGTCTALTTLLLGQRQLAVDHRPILLVGHYFRTVCAIFSCFDSFTNPLRTEIQAAMTTSRLIQSCILSMSAAHLHTINPHWSINSLEYLTAAISAVKWELNTALSGCSLAAMADEKLERLLLAVLILGVTTSWHVSSGLGLEHISGSRALLRTWIARSFSNGQVRDHRLSSLNFYLGLQAYWEAMASFLIDQECYQLDYLFVILASLPTHSIHINPWTGLSAMPWLYLARSGCLIRLKRRLVKRDACDRGMTIGTLQGQDLLPRLEDEARILISQILSYTLPGDDHFEETYDDRTPKAHLKDLAHCCQLAALLELHRAFDIVHEPQATLCLIRNAISTGEHHRMPEENSPVFRTSLVYELSLSIVKILSGIPTDSGTRSLHHLFLLIAGSALLHQLKWEPPPGSIFGSAVVCNVIQGSQSLSDVDPWRQIVLERIAFLEQSLNLDALRRVRLILQEVWVRADAIYCSDAQLATSNPVECLHWIDVMEDADLMFFL